MMGLRNTYLYLRCESLSSPLVPNAFRTVKFGLLRRDATSECREIGRASSLQGLCHTSGSIPLDGENSQTNNISTMRPLIIFLFVVASIGNMPTGAAHENPEAFEVSPSQIEFLPGGKEADGIIGDFVLRNEFVTAVVSSDSPRRRANMSTFWGKGGITPGCLYDLTLRGSDNDQITIFSPSGQRGDVTYVRLLENGSEGRASVETFVSAASNGGVAKRHEYRLDAHSQGILIVTTLENQSEKAVDFDPADRWTTLDTIGMVQEVMVGDAIDPSHKAGYAYAYETGGGFEMPGENVHLDPGQSLSYARFLAVGRSPAEAFGEVAGRRGPTGLLSGRILSEAKRPAPTARALISVDEKQLAAYPDRDGWFRVRLPAGKYRVEIQDAGRSPVLENVSVEEGVETEMLSDLKPASVIRFEIRDEWGRDIPCKVQFLGVNGTATPNLGPPNRAHGCREQYHSETGQFEVAVPPGEYRLIVTRGIEYSHMDRKVKLEEGNSVQVVGRLRRRVDTSGWVSADFHNHSTLSGDNTCGTDDRIINLAAEHIEFAPTTEHNRLYDWQPHIDRLGLSDEVATVSGIELTGPGPHLNSFPLKPSPYTQDWGAPEWSEDPRINALVLRNFQGHDPDRWVHLNHPDMIQDFIDRSGDGQPDGGFIGLGQMIDAIETQNGNSANILSEAPFRIVRNAEGEESLRHVTEFIWLQLLNQGYRFWGVAVADAHSVHGNGVGGWRCYIRSETDLPLEIDWREMSRAAKAGRMFLTTGPFLEVETADGVGPGGWAQGVSEVELHVRVQCNDWVEIDRVQVLVNGEQREDLNYTRETHPDWFQDGTVRFERAIRVPLQRDAHLIVVAFGENFDLETGYGTSPQSNLRPCAYNNPIFVDLDGKGFEPSGELLGFPLPTSTMSVEDAKALMAARQKR